MGKLAGIIAVGTVADGSQSRLAPVHSRIAIGEADRATRAGGGERNIDGRVADIDGGDCKLIGVSAGVTRPVNDVERIGTTHTHQRLGNVGQIFQREVARRAGQPDIGYQQRIGAGADDGYGAP